MTYLEFRHNVYSANGEDGIIKKIFSDLNITEGIVCEFGAANGLDDSNTAALWQQNFQEVLKKLETSYQESKAVETVNAPSSEEEEDPLSYFAKLAES